MDLQMKIRNVENAKREAIKDLLAWEVEIKKKEALLLKQAPTKRNLPPIRGSGTNSSTTGTGIAKNDEIKTKDTNKVELQNDVPPLEDVTTKTLDPKTQSLKEKDIGNEFFKKGQYLSAINAYTTSITLDPTNVLSLANRAMAYINVGNYQDAIADCDSAILVDKSYVKAYARRAAAKKNLKQYQPALEDFEYVLKLEPGNKQALEEVKKLKEILEKEQASKRKKITITEVEGPVPSSPAQPSVSQPKQSQPQPQQKPPQSQPQQKPPQSQPEQKPVQSKPEQKSAQSQPQQKPAQQAQPEQKPAQSQPLPAQETKHDESQVTKSPTQKPSSPKASFPQFQVKIQLPKEPPNTSYEFEAFWNSANDDKQMLFEYLRMIPPPRFPKIFQHSLTAELLTGILTILRDYFLREKLYGQLAEVLTFLCQIPRFDMSLMFLTPKDKEGLQNIFETLLQVEGVDKNQIQQLKSKYKLK